MTATIPTSAAVVGAAASHSPQTLSAAERAADIERFLRLLHTDDALFEIRALHTPRRGTVSGYYTDAHAAARDVASGLEHSGAEGVYVTFNPITPAAQARAANRLRDFARDTTRDEDVLRRRWLLLDFDPVRPSGVSATDLQAQAAIARARRVTADLARQDWPAPLLVASGNGAHLLYRVDLPSDEASRALVARVLSGLATRYDDAQVALDTSTANAARMTKLAGTVARKGDPTDERPHRRALLLNAPPAGELQVVSAELLTSVATPLPSEGSRKVVGRTAGPARPTQRAKHVDDLATWLDAHSVRYRAKPSDAHGARLYELERCPWADHATPYKAFVLQQAGGAISAGCHADKCQGYGFADLRDAYEPGWRAASEHPMEPPTGQSIGQLAGQRGKPQQAQAVAEQTSNADDDFTDAASTVEALAPGAVPFPLDALPAPIRAYVAEGAATIGAPVEYLALPALAAAGTAIGATREIETKPGWLQRPVLWAVVIGQTGTAKSPAQAKALRPVDDRQRQLTRRYDRDLKIWEDSKEEGKGPPPELEQVMTTDATVEALGDVLQRNPRGVVMVRDELSGLVRSLNQYKNGKGSDREHYLSLWTGAQVIVNRRGRGKPLIVERPILGVVGAIPPDILSELADERGREDGFIHRFLFAWPAPAKHRWTEAVISDEVVSAYSALFQRLYALRGAPQESQESQEAQDVRESGEIVPVVVQLSERARELWSAFYDRTQEDLERADLMIALRGPQAKLPVQAARLALILHVCRQQAGLTRSEDVDERSMQDAITIASFFMDHARRVYAHLSTRPEDARAARVVEWMRTHAKHECTPRDLIRAGVAGLHTAQEARELLTDMATARQLGTFASRPDSATGRAQEIFTLYRDDVPDTRQNAETETLGTMA